MKKIIDFIKSNIIIAKWTFWYFFVLWIILRFVFKFDMFDSHYWWKFFHATLHGFSGMVFGLLVYTAIPIYIATTLTIYRKKELIITIPYVDKLVEYISKFLPKKEPAPQPESQTPEKKEDIIEPEFPSDMPPELRVPYTRMKNKLSLTGTISAYNAQTPKAQPVQETTEPEPENAFPIPTDFDISDSLDANTEPEISIPTFTDINFDDEPETSETLENNTTKYFKSKNIEFETYKEFVATSKYVIYEHSDSDFWVMDDKVWFAPGKQIDSPVDELINLGKQNGLIPVIYLESQNIMDIEETINKFENNGIRTVKSLEELD